MIALIYRKNAIKYFYITETNKDTWRFKVYKSIA